MSSNKNIFNNIPTVKDELGKKLINGIVVSVIATTVGYYLNKKRG